MPHSFKVRRGTPDFELAARGGLCASCKHSTIISGITFKQRINRCSMFDRDVNFPVVDCQQYLHKNHPYQHEMESIAWLLVTDTRTKQIGFIKAQDMDEKFYKVRRTTVGEEG